MSRLISVQLELGEGERRGEQKVTAGQTGDQERGSKGQEAEGAGRRAEGSRELGGQRGVRQK